jgi:general secretion pathway protein D
MTGCPRVATALLGGLLLILAGDPDRAVARSADQAQVQVQEQAPVQAQAAPPQAAESAPMTAPAPTLDDRRVRTSILLGTPPTLPTPSPRVETMPGGNISLNLPGVDIQAAAKAVLGDTLGLTYSVEPDLHTPVTVVTPHPIARAAVLPVFEQALATANLVLADRAGSYAILQAATARGEAQVVGPDDPGYGNETLPLKFVNAEEMRKLLDPLVPGAVSVSDPARNLLVVSGNSTQRRALRELVAQFDVDWLRGMSFALFVPQRTDARLIAPELEKLLNGPGSNTAGLVRLITMERLNGILAITAQPQYLEDVRRFMEVLDREGEGAERRVFVYRVQNSKAADLAKVLNAAFGNASSGVAQTDTEATELNDHSAPGGGAPGSGTGLGGGSANGFQANAGQGNAGVPVGGVAGRGAAGGGAAAFAGGAGGGQFITGNIGTPGGAGTTDGGGGRMTIIADEANNAIVVYATPRDYALIEDAMAKLDVPPLQVMIDAAITEVTLNHNLQYGVEWAFQAGRLGGALTSGATSTSTNATTGVTTVTQPGPQQSFPGLSFLYQGNNISATLNALRSVTDVTVLSAPKVIVLNNHTATIQVGDQVPVSTGSATSGLTSGVTTTVEYRDTGIILKVTPRVNAGGLVLLDIAQEVSDVAGGASATTTSPTISQRKIATSVAVQDGETVALGGLIKNEVTKDRTTIPLFGSIPVLGHLFGDSTNGLMRTELLVLLTPRVVRTPVDARAVTAELKEKIHEAAPPPVRSKSHAP